jgi:hypothetical protein
MKKMQGWKLRKQFSKEQNDENRENSEYEFFFPLESANVHWTIKKN